MTLQYLYDPKELADYKIEKAKYLSGSQEVMPPKIRGIKIIRAGKVQRFSDDFVMKAIKEGWMTVGQDRIIIHSDPLVTYLIKCGPGKYSAKTKSGYEVTHYFDCVKED